MEGWLELGNGNGEMNFIKKQMDDKIQGKFEQRKFWRTSREEE